MTSFFFSRFLHALPALLLSLLLCWGPVTAADDRGKDDSLFLASGFPDQPNQGIVNADALRRDHARLQMLTYARALEQLHENDPRYERVRVLYRKSKYQYRLYRRYAAITEQKIYLLRVYNPTLYDHISTLRTEFGKPVAAMVGVKERFSEAEATGETYVRYSFLARSQEPVPFLREEKADGISLLPYTEYALKISIATDGDLADVRHELGHFAYSVTQSSTYFGYLTHLNRHGHAHNGGHNHDDASGVLARKYETWRR